MTTVFNPAKIPLSLYVHIPWCARKCPYCDFNSHAQKHALPEAAYVTALLDDLASELPAVAEREIGSIFFGGGTPSLFSEQAIGTFLQAAEQQLQFATDIEITLEANPGSAEAQRFAGFRAAGVNRLSIGVQSLNQRKLEALGRIHGREEALEAVAKARQAGFENFNLDLMYALPGQSLPEAKTDLLELLGLGVTHISWYQLTLEPNTLFYRQPPPLPDSDLTADIMDMGLQLLSEHGYQQYEISAHAQPGKACRHNLNYWQFGDYLGIGAGAHGKLSLSNGQIERRTRLRHPQAYLDSDDRLSQRRTLSQRELPIEFMLNALRLNDGVPQELFNQHTGLGLADLQPQLSEARSRGLLSDSSERLQATPLGARFLNDLLAIFEP